MIAVHDTTVIKKLPSSLLPQRPFYFSLAGSLTRLSVQGFCLWKTCSVQTVGESDACSSKWHV